MSAPRTFAALFLFVTLLWPIALLVAPYVATHWAGSGALGPTDAAAALYAFAHYICHQRPERSFHAWGLQLAVCARCCGLYFAAPLGALLAVACRAPKYARRWRRNLTVAALPLTVTWMAEWVEAAHLSLPMRAASAVPLGIVGAWLVGAAIVRDLR